MFRNCSHFTEILSFIKLFEKGNCHGCQQVKNPAAKCPAIWLSKVVAFLEHTVLEIRSFYETIMNVIASLIGILKDMFFENSLNFVSLVFFQPLK